MDFTTPIISKDQMVTLLKQSLVKEKLTESILCKIPDDFYQSLHIEMDKLDDKWLDEAKDILNEFTRIRHSKIIQFASVLKLNNHIRENLSDEEKNYYDAISKSTKLFLSKIQKPFNTI